MIKAKLDPFESLLLMEEQQSIQGLTALVQPVFENNNPTAVLYFAQTQFAKGVAISTSTRKEIADYTMTWAMNAKTLADIEILKMLTTEAFISFPYLKKNKLVKPSNLESDAFIRYNHYLARETLVGFSFSEKSDLEWALKHLILSFEDLPLLLRVREYLLSNNLSDSASREHLLRAIEFLGKKKLANGYLVLEIELKYLINDPWLLKVYSSQMVNSNQQSDLLQRVTIAKQSNLRQWPYT